MNAETAIATYVFGLIIVVLIGLVIRSMLRGWRHRAERQAELVGNLPVVPELFGAAAIPPTTGLYLGSTLAPNWLERVNAGDLGYRCKAVLTRYADGILMERFGAGPIWMPRESVESVRTVRALAGKVLPTRAATTEAGGILVIRWTLPSGTVIDTGFRGDDRGAYPAWTATADAKPTADDKYDDSTGESQ